MINYEWQKFINNSKERCGVVLKNGDVVELPNKHPEPERNFMIMADDIEPYLEELSALWHTHCDGSYNLSMNDYQLFVSKPELDQFIISDRGVALYRVDNGFVMNVERRLFDA